MSKTQNKKAAALLPLHRSRQARLVIISGLLILSLLGGFGLPTLNAAAAPDAPTAPAQEGSYIWSIQRVDAPPTFANLTDRHLTLDRSDRPHMAYGGDHLYYSWYDGSTWRNEVVDAGQGVGEYASIAVDRDNRVHIAYYDSASGSLKYALRENNAWTLQLIDQPDSTAALEVSEFESANPWEQADRPWRAPELLDTQAVDAATAGGVGLYTSIAVDSNRRPHISYYDADNKDLKYAHWTGSAWDIDRVDSAGTVGKYSSLALDDSNDPYIAYYNDSIDGLRFAEKTSSGWDKDTVEQFVEGNNLYPGSYSSLAVSSSGKPYISYYEYDLSLEEGYLKYATLTSGSWVKEYVDKEGGDDVGQYTSIALNSDGNPGISYYDAEKQNLMYARRSGGSWSREIVDSTDDTGLWTSLVYAGNSPRIGYYDVTSGALTYVAWRNSDWSFTTVASSREVGLSTSLALDGANDPHISYFNDSTDDLKLAVNPGSSWQITELDLNAAGSFNSLTLNAAGEPRIAYYRADTGDLWYFYKIGVTNYFEPVDTGGDVGQYVSLTLDSAGYPHVSYYDRTNGDLKYAYKGPSNVWTFLTVDSAGDVGQYTSIEVDNHGDARVSYYDATNQDLKFAYRDFSGNWHSETVITDANSGQYTSLALDADFRPYISFYDATNADLRLAIHQAPGSWSIETLDSAGTVGQYSSIAIDPTPYVHISYYDATNGNLNYIRQTSAGWVRSVVDASGDVGKYSSLDLTSITPSTDTIEPRISYFDASEGHLKYAAGLTPIAWLHLPVVVR